MRGVVVVVVVVAAACGPAPDVLTFNCQETLFCRPGTTNVGATNGGCPDTVESSDGFCFTTEKHDVDATTKEGAESIGCDNASAPKLEIDCTAGDTGQGEPVAASCVAVCD